MKIYVERILLGALLLSGAAPMQGAAAQTRAQVQAVNLMNKIETQQARLDTIVSNMSTTEVQNLINATSNGQFTDSNGDGIPDSLAVALGSDSCTDLTGTGVASSTNANTQTLLGNVNNVGQNTITVGGQLFNVGANTQVFGLTGQPTTLDTVFTGQCAVVQAFQPFQSASAAFQAQTIQNIACSNNTAPGSVSNSSSTASSTGTTGGTLGSGAATGGSNTGTSGTNTSSSVSSGNTNPGMAAIGLVSAG